VRRNVRIAVALSVLLLCSGRAAAQAPPRIRTTVDPGVLLVASAPPGSQPTPITDATTTYNVRVNAASFKKITAQLNAPMPAGVTLTVTLAPPPGATSLGPVSLDAVQRDVVVNVTNVNATFAVTYQLSATVAAGVLPPATRTVTFNLVDYP
jgi:hypothetical protein